MDQGTSATSATELSARPSIEVRDVLSRTVEKHGISRSEVDRFSGAFKFMEVHLSRRRRLWFLSVDKGSSREKIAAIGKSITNYQRRNLLPCYNLAILETIGGLHAHMIFVGRRDRAPEINGAQIGPVTKAEGLQRIYLVKERTPQAGYLREHLLGHRRKGSHKLQGGGDRVRLSRELDRDAIEAGYVEPWRRTNAKRKDWRKDHRPRPLTARTLQPAGQLILLPELERPVSRFRDFGGGIVPPAVKLELELYRRRLGLTQRDLAARIGISQGQYANAIRGHDPISEWVARRLREVLAGPIAPGPHTDGRRVA